MAKRTRFSEYRDRYANYRFEFTDDGTLFIVQLHTNDGSLVWDWRARDQMSDAFADIAGGRGVLRDGRRAGGVTGTRTA